MAELSTEQIYGLMIRESADDGSDFPNPPTDYRLVFLGEDGRWHAKDSVGAVTLVTDPGLVAHGGLLIRESADDGSDFSNPATDYRWAFVGEDGKWHYKDAAGAVGVLGVGDTSWIVPTLLNSWVSYGAPYEVEGYRKDGQGFVHLRGLIKNGTATAGTALFNLPAGYRPANTALFDTQSNGALGRVDVANNGNVTIQAGTNAWISLNGITFYGDV